VQDTSDETENGVLLFLGELQDIESVLARLSWARQERVTTDLDIVEFLLIRHAIDVDHSALPGEVEQLGVLKFHSSLELFVCVSSSEELVEDVIISLSVLRERRRGGMKGG
jgi:hypothetical protein